MESLYLVRLIDGEFLTNTTFASNEFLKKPCIFTVEGLKMLFKSHSLTGKLIGSTVERYELSKSTPSEEVIRLLGI